MYSLEINGHIIETSQNSLQTHLLKKLLGQKDKKRGVSKLCVLI